MRAAFALAIVLLVATAAASAGGGAASGSSGRALFTANCSSCHVLAAAHARGKVGPNLDRRYRGVSRRRIRSRVRRAIVRGSAGMPAGILTGRDVDVVAAYVARVSRRR